MNIIKNNERSNEELCSNKRYNKKYNGKGGDQEQQAEDNLGGIGFLNDIPQQVQPQPRKGHRHNTDQAPACDEQHHDDHKEDL